MKVWMYIAVPMPRGWEEDVKAKSPNLPVFVANTYSSLFYTTKEAEWFAENARGPNYEYIVFSVEVEV